MSCQTDSLKPNRLSELRHDDLFPRSDVLARLRKLVESSSALTYAIRGPYWGDKEISGLVLRVKDWVSYSVGVCAMTEFRKELRTVFVP